MSDEKIFFDINGKIGNYTVLENSDGKIWYFDNSNLKLSVCLYQPTSIKGFLIKKVIIYFPFFNKKRKCISDMFLKFISNKLNVDYKELSFSFFFGTPGVHRKSVFQISYRGKIIAYGKVTNSNNIYSLFKNEFFYLKKLNSLGVKNIPNIYYCGKLYSGYNILLQSTEKQTNFIVPNDLSELQFNFLLNLYDNTKKELPFEKSNYYRNLKKIIYFCEHNNFSDEYISYIVLIKKAIKKLIEFYKDNFYIGYLCHRDFTPWNMYIMNEQLYVFDWEYAIDEYPPLIDLFHFIIQKSKFEYKNDNQNLLDNISKFIHEKQIKSYFQDYIAKDLNIYLMSYLVDIIGLYLLRDNPDAFENNFHMYRDWLTLLDSVFNKV